MRFRVQHESRWTYPRPAILGPHTIRLRPAHHAQAHIEQYTLRVSPPGAAVHWQQDATGNSVARLTYPYGVSVRVLSVAVDFVCDVTPSNPFDFLVDDGCATLPFAYLADLAHDLAPYLDTAHPSLAGGPRVAALLERLPRTGPTIEMLGAFTAAVTQATHYIVREAEGIWTPERTLTEGRGSCRDSTVVLMAVLRARGLAARFVSGYLVERTSSATDGAVDDAASLHAWTEVYIPGGGWIGLDSTSGLFSSAGHIPLACAATPALAAPIEGTSDTVATDVSFTVRIARLAETRTM